MGYWAFLREASMNIIPMKKEDINLPSIIGGGVVVLTIIGFLTSSFDKVAKWLSTYLAADTPHVLPKVILGIGLVVVLYLLLFVYHAPVLALRRGRESQEANASLRCENELLWGKMNGLERDKVDLVKKSNYRDQLAAAVGLKLLSVHRDCEILNLKGDCTLHEHEQFLVLGLSLADLIRRQASRCTFRSKTPPTVHVTPLPDQTTYETNFEETNGFHRFHIYFRPPLERTNPDAPLNLFIAEEVEQAFLMSREEIPDTWKRTERRESISHVIAEPTENLEISITFPLGYMLRKDDASLRVLYGRSESRHIAEEDRLTRQEALKIYTLGDGRTKLRMFVDEPLLGLSYLLCWTPIPRKELAALKERLTAKTDGAPA
jgi:hypothetical protein